MFNLFLVSYNNILTILIYYNKSSIKIYIIIINIDNNYFKPLKKLKILL